MALKTLQIRLTDAQLAYLDRLIKAGVISDRSVGVRLALYIMMENVGNKTDVLDSIEQAQRR